MATQEGAICAPHTTVSKQRSRELYLPAETGPGKRRLLIQATTAPHFWVTK